MLDILHLGVVSVFHYSHIQIYSLRICSLSFVPRGSLVFSVVNLVFVLVVLSISLCKCRFLDLVIWCFFASLRSAKVFGNVVFLFLVCSLSYLFHCTRAKGSHRLCFVFSRSPFRFVCRCYSICLLCLSHVCQHAVI